MKVVKEGCLRIVAQLKKKLYSMPSLTKSEELQFPNQRFEQCASIFMAFMKQHTSNA